MKYFTRSAFNATVVAGLAGLLLGTVSQRSLLAQGVLTWHNDAARTGQYPTETLLTPANVNSGSFGLKFNLSVDGKVDAQPLYVPGLTIASAPHNVLYVATENDTLYAFDADAEGTGAGTPPLWLTSLIPAGESVSDKRGCSQVSPTIGVTSTPVIDLAQGANGTIYAVAMTKDGSGNYHQRLHAIDLVTGLEQSGWPVEVATSGFDPKQYKERAALTITNGMVYTTWASHCDIGAYNGWVIGYSEANPAQAPVVLNLTPHGSQGAIWMSGAGPAADAGGSLFLLTGNGTFDTTLNGSGFPISGDYGNAFVELSTLAGLGVTNYFTTFNTVSESNGDQDLGSGGTMLLPTLNGHILVVGAGKDGNAYIVDTGNMGKFNPSNNSGAYQVLPLAGAVFSSPAWFNNTLYYGPIGSPISAYAFSGTLFNTSPASSTTHSFGTGQPNTGGTPTVSYAPSPSGTGTANAIVWAADTTGSNATPELFAFDPNNNLAELYDSTQAGTRDVIPNNAKGVTFPWATVANGHVYVGTTNSVAVFGLLSNSCTYTVPGSLPQVPAAGEALVIHVTPNPSTCSWSAASGSSFLAITRIDEPNGNVYVTVGANPGLNRTATIAISGQIVTIPQASGLGTASNPSPANNSVGITINNPSLSWTPAANATSYDIYFGTSSTPPFITNVASSNYAPGTTLTQGTTYYWKVVARNSSGTNPAATTWSFTTNETTAVSVTPNSGSALSQTFTLQYADSSGASSLQTVYALFNVTLSSQSNNACMMYYTPASNQINLLNDAATSWTTATLGAATTLQNSQCSVSAAGSSFAKNGNTLTLNLAMTFQTAFAGAKNVYLMAIDGATGNSAGWQQLGTWTVPSQGGGGGIPPGAVPVCNQSGAPCVVSLSPANGTGPSGTITGVFTHSGGPTMHYLGYILFLPTPNIVWYTATGSCLVEYNRISNAMRLIDDAGTNWLPGIIGLPIGQPGTLTNSHCSLNVGQSSATINGTVMTVNAAVTFNPSFTGKLATFMQAFDVTDAYTGMTQFGNWEVSAGTQKPGPYVVSLSPTSGTGSSTTLTFTAGHTSGVSSISFVTMLISSVIVGGTPCQAFYWPSTNILNLVDDSGTAMVSTNGITVGTAGSLSNSRCTINTGGATSGISGNNVTVSLPMTFSTANFGGTQNIYLATYDDFGNLSHWVTSGTWTVQ